MKYLFLLLMLTACGKQVNYREGDKPLPTPVNNEWSEDLNFARYDSVFTNGYILPEDLTISIEQVMGFTYHHDDGQDVHIYRNNNLLCSLFFNGFNYSHNCFYSYPFNYGDVIRAKGVVNNQSITLRINFRRE